jgi:hypothetical protein
MEEPLPYFKKIACGDRLRWLENFGRGSDKSFDYFHALGSIATDCWFSIFSNQPFNVKNIFSNQQLVIIF